jgi:uncharacterized protein YndB with AHSA1/START domain
MQVEVSRTIAVDADSVFALITTPERLPEWNSVIRATLEAPDELVPGAQWVVEFRALGQSWPSRSTVTTLDRPARLFAYRSQTDDGNPSHADWMWRIDPSASGCELRVTVDVHPQTFWRRVLLAHVRVRQLRNEIPRSLDALAMLAVAVEQR